MRPAHPHGRDGRLQLSEKKAATDAIDVQLSDWSEAVSLIRFLDSRGLRGFPVPADAAVIRVIGPAPAAAQVETFAALHAFLDSGTADELLLSTHGRTFTMRRKLQPRAPTGG